MQPVLCSCTPTNPFVRSVFSMYQILTSVQVCFFFPGFLAQPVDLLWQTGVFRSSISPGGRLFSRHPHSICASPLFSLYVFIWTHHLNVGVVYLFSGFLLRSVLFMPFNGGTNFGSTTGFFLSHKEPSSFCSCGQNLRDANVSPGRCKAWVGVSS